VRARVALAWLALAWVAAVAPAAAQEPPAAYREIIADAVTEFDEGRWPEARALFERAHALFPNARTLRGIGMCAFEMRQYAEAIRHLEWALSEPRRALTEAQREETEALVERARTFVGRFRVTTDPPGAEVRIDGAVPRRGEDGAVMLAVGEHNLVARAPGREDATRALTVTGGEDAVVTLSLGRAGVGAPSDASIALFIAAGGLLLIEPFTMGWWVDRESEVESCRAPPMGTACVNAPTLGEQRDAAAASSIIVGVVALGVAATGLLLWLLGPDASDSVACGPSRFGVGCAF